MDKVKEILILQKINKVESLRCVRCPKVEIFIEMFSAYLQNLVWSRHVGVPLWCTKLAAGKHLELTLVIWGNYYLH